LCLNLLLVGLGGSKVTMDECRVGLELLSDILRISGAACVNGGAGDSFSKSIDGLPLCSLVLLDVGGLVRSGVDRLVDRGRLSMAPVLTAEFVALSGHVENALRSGRVNFLDIRLNDGLLSTDSEVTGLHVLDVGGEVGLFMALGVFRPVVGVMS